MSAKESINSVHILSDVKFLPWIKQTFSLQGWNTFYILLNHQEKKMLKELDSDTIEVSSDAFGESIIVEKLKSFDIAFHYLLNNTKAEIIRKSGKDIIHCWCFYGAEIYQQTNLFRNSIYGPLTKEMFWTLPEKRFRYELRKWYYTFWKREASPIDSLRKAIPGIYAILWYVEEEMEMINQKIKLPPWRFFQFFSFDDIIPAFTDNTDVQSKRILIGNSATIENNHADVLPLLTAIEDQAYTFSLPLTYGQFSRYKTNIKAMYKRKLGERVTFLEGHLSLKDYYAFLQQHPTAIFLHYRQQGLGNILYLLYTGTKVYLSQHNIVYLWLKKNGIEVFIFEKDFLKDAQAQQLTLDQETIVHNQRKIKDLLDHQRNDLTIKALEEEVYLRKKEEPMTSLSDTQSKIGIVGSGGLGKEVLCCFGELFGWKDLHEKVTFLVEEEFFIQDNVKGIDVLPFSRHIHDFSRIVIAIGDLGARIRIKGLLPPSTKFETVIHPGAILTPFTHIGEGSIVLGNTFLSCDVQIGRFAIINPGTTISHDTRIGDYFTGSPGINISGQCTVGERVFMGTNSCTRNAITIGDDVIIGMGAVVVKNILQAGTYVGNPADLI